MKCPKQLCRSCSTKKPSSSRIKTFKFSKRFSSDGNRRQRLFKFLRRKKTSIKPKRCFTCGRKGHFAKQCPQGKPTKLMTYIQDEIGLPFSDNDLDSLLSVDDEIGLDTICALEGYTKMKECYKISGIHTMHSCSVISIQIIPTKYAKPIKVAAFFDKGTSFTVMNPDILPP